MRGIGMRKALSEPFIVSMQASLKSKGDVCDGRRTGQADDRYSDSCRQSACVVTVHEPEVRGVNCEIEQRGPRHHE